MESNIFRRFPVWHFFATGLTYFQSKSMTLTTFIVKVGKNGSMNSWDSESSSKLDMEGLEKKLDMEQLEKKVEEIEKEALRIKDHIHVGIQSFLGIFSNSSNSEIHEMDIFQEIHKEKGSTHEANIIPYIIPYQFVLVFKNGLIDILNNHVFEPIYFILI